MNIVFIVGDALRTKNLSCYGNPKGTTPTIDRLAREGVLFEDAYACADQTDSSFTTMLSGKYPLSHGITRHGSRAHGVTKEQIRILNKTTILFPEILKSHGYYTMAFDWLGRWHKRGYDFYGETDGFSFALGVEKCLEHLPEKTSGYFKRKLYRIGFALPSRSGKCYTDIAIKFIKRNHENNFFMLFHNWDTHTPFSTLPFSYVHKFYEGKGGEKVEEMLKRIENDKWREIVKNYHLQGVKYMNEIPALYDAAANYFDYSVKRLLECLEDCGIIDETIVVVTADHGDNAVRDGIFVGHAGLYDPVIHIPLIIKGPGVPRNKSVNGFVQHVDLVPTLLELLDIKFDISTQDGVSLLPLINGQKKSLRTSVLAQCTTARRRYAIRTSDYKYIYSPTPDESLISFDIIGCRYPIELYDLRADPNETKNIVADRPDVAEEMKEKLLRRIKELESKRDKRIKKSEITKVQDKISRFKKMGKKGFQGGLKS